MVRSKCGGLISLPARAAADPLHQARRALGFRDGDAIAGDLIHVRDSVGGDWRWRSALDAGPVAPLTANDLVALFEGAFSFAVLALPFHLSGLLLHVGLSMRALGRAVCLAKSRAR